MKNLIQVSVRQSAIFIPKEQIVAPGKKITRTTAMLVANLAKIGFSLSEELLHAMNTVSPAYKLEIYETLSKILGTDKNWTPLVKGWNIPTGETELDHFETFLATIFNSKDGTPLECGHIIPYGTFPIERYNGCPFCGTPFQFGKIEKYGQGSKTKLLNLWTEDAIQSYFADLLQSKTALDATQIDSLKILVDVFPLPKVTVGMKETLMIIVDALVEKGAGEKAEIYFTSPTDILRYLWYKKTGVLQIMEPKTIIKQAAKNSGHFQSNLNQSAQATLSKKLELKLKYNRQECKMVAVWINNLELDIEKTCEMMHPKREMWVRFIRALRLAEYSKKEGFEKLKDLLDVFYNEIYTVWQGRVNQYRLKSDAINTFVLLKQRPGLFARSLFSTMLWYGAEETIKEFTAIIDQVPARLIFTLNMYAQNYFDKDNDRIVKPLGGTIKRIPANKFLGLYTEEQLNEMKALVEGLSITVMKKRFAAIPNENKTIYIDPMLFNIPVAIGDRSDTVQDLPAALPGTKFQVEGDAVRLFMQWGKDLPAQHLDMDLSCQIAYSDGKHEICSYSHLTATGAQHSGDIRSIPDKIGTAEYIELDINALKQAKAQYVTFTCNAFSTGAISPNLVIGWMNSKHKMKISEKTGVAYDPSCVQHQVRVVQNAAKGIVFGVLDVWNNEIIWLEMAFGGQVVQNLDFEAVKGLISKLNTKLNIGNLLLLKAEAQNLKSIETEDADEVYSMEWALNSAAVTKLLVD